MGKGARIKQLRVERKDRSHTLVTKTTNPRKMNNPANAVKAVALVKPKPRIALLAK